MIVQFIYFQTNLIFTLCKGLKSNNQGHGTEEGIITRIIATRADKDLATIKEMYFEMFDETLSKAVQVGFFAVRIAESLIIIIDSLKLLTVIH